MSAITYGGGVNGISLTNVTGGNFTITYGAPWGSSESKVLVNGAKA